MNARRTATMSTVALAAMGLMPMIASAQQAAPADGQWYFDAVRVRIQQLGHRNWICIVDAAYPVQTSPGIEMVVVPEDHQTVVKRVLDELAFQGHVRPIVYLDDELDVVPEADAKGIGQLRGDLRKAIGDREVKLVPHAEIIEKLAAAGEKFQVLMLKTNLKLPYTSVFIELDCGYWSPEAEQRLRAAMAAPAP
jgi:hypothetical protein